MASNKQPNKEDIDALLALAEQPPDPKEKAKELNSVEQWVIDKDIVTGEHLITPYQMYYEYKKWASKPLNFVVFYRELSKILKTHRGVSKDGSGKYYLVNPEPFDLSLDTHFVVLKELREARELRRKRYNDKKKAQGKPESPKS